MRVQLANATRDFLRDAAKAELEARLGAASANAIAAAASAKYEGALLALVHELGILPEHVTGFDDASGELILTDEAPALRRRRRPAS